MTAGSDKTPLVQPGSDALKAIQPLMGDALIKPVLEQSQPTGHSSHFVQVDGSDVSPPVNVIGPNGVLTYGDSSTTQVQSGSGFGDRIGGLQLDNPTASPTGSSTPQAPADTIPANFYQLTGPQQRAWLDAHVDGWEQKTVSEQNRWLNQHQLAGALLQGRVAGDQHSHNTYGIDPDNARLVIGAQTDREDQTNNGGNPNYNGHEDPASGPRTVTRANPPPQDTSWQGRANLDQNLQNEEHNLKTPVAGYEGFLPTVAQQYIIPGLAGIVGAGPVVRGIQLGADRLYDPRKVTPLEIHAHKTVSPGFETATRELDAKRTADQLALEDLSKKSYSLTPKEIADADRLESRLTLFNWMTPTAENRSQLMLRYLKLKEYNNGRDVFTPEEMKFFEDRSKGFVALSPADFAMSRRYRVSNWLRESIDDKVARDNSLLPKEIDYYRHHATITGAKLGDADELSALRTRVLDSLPADRKKLLEDLWQQDDRYRALQTREQSGTALTGEESAFVKNVQKNFERDQRNLQALEEEATKTAKLTAVEEQQFARLSARRFAFNATDPLVSVQLPMSPKAKLDPSSTASDVRRSIEYGRDTAGNAYPTGGIGGTSKVEADIRDALLKPGVAHDDPALRSLLATPKFEDVDVAQFTPFLKSGDNLEGQFRALQPVLSKPELDAIEGRITHAGTLPGREVRNDAALWGKDRKNAFLQGAAWTTLSAMGFNYLDKAVNGNEHHQGLEDPVGMWGAGLNMAALPIIFSNKKSSMEQKATYLAGAWGLGLVLDHVMPESNGPYTAAAAFSPSAGGNLIIGGAAGLASVVPEELKGRKYGVIAAGVGLAVAFNWWQSSHSDYTQAKNKADHAESNDQSTRTASSLNDEIDAWKALGEHRPYYLDLKIQDISAPDKTPQTDADWDNRRRDSIALRTAFAEVQLEKGSFINTNYRNTNQKSNWENVLGLGDRNEEAENGSYILNGLNLDLGGKAMNQLDRTLYNIAQAKAKTPDLDQIEQRVNADLAKIYGPHDIDKAYMELCKFADPTLNGKYAYDEWARLRKALGPDMIKDTEKEYGDKGLAKLERDFALLSLALNGKWGTPTNMATTQEAVAAIAASLKYDPNNSDAAKMMDIAQQQNSGAQQWLQQIQQNGAFDPLNFMGQVRG